MKRTRRQFLGTGLALGGLAIAPSTRAQNPWAAALEGWDAPPAPPFSRPMPVLSARAPTEKRPDADVYELAARAGEAHPLAGASTRILGFDGAWPGPLIRATRGRAVVLRVKNQLDENLSVHNHGMTCAPESDGHPMDWVRPGASKEYRYPNQQSAGTYWYHDHAMGLTGAHVYRGLAGAYVIDDPAESALGLPHGEHDLVLMLQDRLFDAEHQLRYSVETGTIFKGFLGNAMCVNGVYAPHTAVAARRYRLRLINGCNSRNLRLALDGGMSFVQIGSDGALLPAPVSRTELDLAPAERADVVVDFGKLKPGASVTMRNVDATFPAAPDVLRFDVTRAAKDDSRVPKQLRAIARLDPRRAVVERRVTLSIDDGHWTLNGLRYDPARIDFRPKLGTTEIWTIRNAESTQMHPFHQHLVPFQVLDVDGARPPAWLAGEKDTVAVEPGATVRIIMRFTGFTGVYVFHCHKLEHEDFSMMLQQEVIA